MKKSRLRRFHGESVVRLIVSVEADQVARIDSHLVHGLPSCAMPGNRSEFVRLAIEEKLVRDSATAATL